MDGGRPFDIKPCGMLALDVARIEAGLLLIEVDFFSSKKAHDRVAAVLAVRDGAGPSGEPRQGPLHRAARAAARNTAAGRRGRWSGSRSTGPKSEAIYDERWASRRPSPRPRHASPCLSTAAAVRSARATTTTWSPVLKRMIALATIDRPHYAEGTEAPVRGDRRSRAPPRRRHGREDAVLQSAAEDGDAGLSRSTVSGSDQPGPIQQTCRTRSLSLRRDRACPTCQTPWNLTIIRSNA